MYLELKSWVETPDALPVGSLTWDQVSLPDPIKKRWEVLPPFPPTAHFGGNMNEPRTVEHPKGELSYGRLFKCAGDPSVEANWTLHNMGWGSVLAMRAACAMLVSGNQPHSVVLFLNEQTTPHYAQHAAH